MAQTPVALPKLDGTLGAVFVGVTVSAILYGITCLQTFAYFTESSKKDRIVYRVLIGLLWILDGLQLAFTAHLLYYFVITNYFNPVALTSSPWSAEAFNVVTNISDLIVRSILIDRIWRLCKTPYLPGVLMLGNLATSAFSLSCSAKFQKIGDIQHLGPIKGLIIGVFTCIAGIDTLIAISLVVILWGRRTGFKRTDSQLQTLMMYSVHTGALTSLVAICVVITFATMPTKFIYIALFFTLPKFYINALLATLNARETMRAERRNESSGFTSVHVSRTQVSTASADPTQRTNLTHSEARPEVIMLTESFKDSKDDSMLDSKFSTQFLLTYSPASVY
ncbi:hypothetical protein C8Q75DRAFT_107881 [Abortiporus biennis]|nr:hypothetical protein C8Q75DRAFT_107881 [Abortiporus biennis]